MNLGIEDKKVLVTGASQGIGKEIALQFSNEGCLVTIIARSKEKLEEVLVEMGGEENGHQVYAVDLMPEGAPTKVVKELVEKNINYDIVVHNVGGTLEVRDPLSPVIDWYNVWRFNAGIAIEMNHILIPLMQKRKWGRVVHISSEAAVGLRGCPAYGASKAYLNAYSKVLGKNVAKEGVVVSAIAPGAIDAPGGHWDENNDENSKTAETMRAFLRKKEDFLRHHQSIGRLGRPEEIACFALFMASKHVTFANGTIIYVDGGTE